MFSQEINSWDIKEFIYRFIFVQQKAILEQRSVGKCGSEVVFVPKGLAASRRE